MSSVQLCRKTGDLGQVWDAVRRPTYCINVTARPALFTPLVAELGKILRRPPPAGGPILFSTQFHADELVRNRSALYDLQSVKPNLEALVRVCLAADAQVEFTQARRIAALWA